MQTSSPSMHKAALAHRARVDLLGALRQASYHFVTPSPASHRTVIQRPAMRRGKTLRDIFGWSLPFDEAALPKEIAVLLDAAGALREMPEGLRSALRVSSLDQDLFLHSAFPAEAEDAVFFGPDTYRFAAFIRDAVRGRPRPQSAVDVGTGAGAGAVTVARTVGADRLCLTDSNPHALELAQANCEAAGVEAEYIQTDGLAGVQGRHDLIVANPPYIAGTTGRTYSEGGQMHGARLSLDWAIDGAQRLRPEGRLALYTGSSIIGGEDRFKTALATRLATLGHRLRYREIDPDVFGEELAKDVYQDVDRIAVIGAVIDGIT